MTKLIAALVLNAVTTYLLGVQSKPQDKLPSYDKPVNHFESHTESALESILRLGAETKVPLGVVRSDDSLCQIRVSLSADKESALSITNRLTAGTAYQPVVRDGTLVIEPKTMPPNTAKLLNMVVERYTAPPSTTEGLGLFLWRDVYASLHPAESTLVHYLSSPDAVQIAPFEMRNATVQQILNRIVNEGMGGEWVLPPIPDDYPNKQDQKLADLVGYSDDPAGKIQRISCTQ